MKIDKKIVEHIALLSRLSFTEEEKEKFSKQLSQILDHVEKIGELDLTGVEATSHVIDLRDIFREDDEIPSIPREAALKNAPHSEREQFKVPRIV